MKTKFLSLLFCLSMVACAQQSADDAGDDQVVNPEPEPEPEPTPDTECEVDADCADEVACAAGACDGGACVYEPICGDDEVCNEDTDSCEDHVESLPDWHRVRCFANNGTLYVTISGKLTDANYGGDLVAPTHVSLASDAIAGSWDTTTPPSTYRIALSSQETALGGLVSGSIAVPEELAQRFTLLIWPATGDVQRFDLSSWDISGDTCARISDGSEDGGSSDGHIIGRAPLCPSACDDGDASTDDVCTPTGCTHDGGPPPAAPLVSCAESGVNTNVTISGGILAHLNTDVVPDGTWSVCFGYGGTSCVAWVSDPASYTLPMPNTVTEFSFVLKNGSGIVQSWFDVEEFTSNGTCSVNAAGTAFLHAPQSSIVGTIQCQMTASGKRRVTIVPNAYGILAGTNPDNAGGVLLPSPSAIQVGYGDWVLPYAAGSTKPQCAWNGDTATCSVDLDPAVDDFNFFAVDNDDGADSWSGGDFFNLDKWTVLPGAGCTRVGGGISTN